MGIDLKILASQFRERRGERLHPFAWSAIPVCLHFCRLRRSPVSFSP